MHTVRLRILNLIIIGSYPAWEEMDGCEEDIFDPRASKCVSAVFHRGSPLPIDFRTILFTKLSFYVLCSIWSTQQYSPWHQQG